MKNYLKKAISAVIALALAASIVPASFAADVVLTDVPETADYATAVNVLVALDIVNGYEDNTFLPDNKITRAEASKIIVAALNETASAEAMKGATKFSDIEAKHEWATGYINKGVSLGYINGMENNQFQPDGNVTYAQMIKMLLCAMGYEDYAVSLAEQYNYTGANWYVPYTQLAADAEVSTGVYAAPNEAVTRAQVAQLVYNAIKAPIVKNTGVTYTDSGKIVPTIQVQNGAWKDNIVSIYYRSLLTEKFDAYYVEGFVTATQKDGTGLKADEVDFGIAKSQAYKAEDIQFEKAMIDYSQVSNAANKRILPKVNVGNTNAADYKGTYATAIIMIDDYEDWSILHFEPSGKNKIVKFDVKDLDTEKHENADGTLNAALAWNTIKVDKTPYLEFFADGATKSTKYLLASTGSAAPYSLDVEVYVNGISVSTGDPVWDYVYNAEVGEITLTDIYKTDGKYDAINVDHYATGTVDSIDEDGELIFKDITTGTRSIELDDDDTELEYVIYYNGEEISKDQLLEDDVVSIAYDVTADADQEEALEKSKFYEIYVSRDIVNDTLKGKDKEDKAAKLGDTYYEFLSQTSYNTFAGSAELGDEYSLYLDAFGRVYDYKKNESSANWGVATRYTKSSADDDYKLTIVTADGSTKSYFVDGDKVELSIDGVKNTYVSEDDTNNKIYAEVYNGRNATVDKTDSTPVGPEYRVVTYKIAPSTGMINKLSFEKDSTSTGAGVREEFVARNKKIGSTVRMNDATKIIDATKWSEKDYSAASLSALTDGVSYEAYAYGKQVDGSYPFVLIKAGSSLYNANTRFAVVTEDGYAEEEDAETQDIIYAISAMYGDSEVIYATDDVTETDLNSLKQGDVIYFETNEKGYIKKFDKIFALGNDLTNYAAVKAATLVANNTDAKINADGTAGTDGLTDKDTAYTMPSYVKSFVTAPENRFDDDFTKNWTASDKDAIKVIFAPVIKAEDGVVTFAKMGNGIVDDAGTVKLSTDVEGKEEAVNGVVEFNLANNANIYTFDATKSKNNKFSRGTASSIAETSIATSDYYKTSIIDWTNANNQEKVAFAFAIVAEGDIVDIFSICHF